VIKAREIFVPAVLSNLTTLDTGEIRVVELTLPADHEWEGISYPIQDRMRPGTAALIKPFGSRTKKERRRMYTRSNCSLGSERVFETIVNHTHKDQADTSIWWQTEEVEKLHREKGALAFRVEFQQDQSELVLFENASKGTPSNLRLEADDEWPSMRLVALCFSSGICPFLSYLRYMQALDFGRTLDQAGCHMTLIASARNSRQLMAHEALLDLERAYPLNFRYHPVLTREWPKDWEYTRGRIFRAMEVQGGETVVDICPLLDVCPDIENTHVRMCGGKTARFHMEQGLAQNNKIPLSLRTEVW